MKGFVVGFEKGTDTCTFAVVQLCSKTLQVFNYEVALVRDEKKNWAMNEYAAVTSRYTGLQKLDSEEIQEVMSDFFAGSDVYFVRNTQTLDIMADVFNITKTKIYIVNKKLCHFERFSCVSRGGGHSDFCAIDDVVAMTNFICNLSNLPNNLEIASADASFKFKAQSNFVKNRFTLKTADKVHFVKFCETESDDSE